MEFNIETQQKSFQDAKERAFRDTVERSLVGREPLEAICIDDPKVKIPEDSITVTENRDGSFFVRASFPDLGILDPQANTLKNLVERLQQHPDKPIAYTGGSKFKRKLIFDEENELPCLTVQGNFRADKGISDVEIIKTRVSSNMYTYEDHSALEEDARYLSAWNFAFSFAKYQSKVGTNSRFVTVAKKDLEVHPASVVEQSMVFANTAAGKFLSEGNYASLFRVYDSSTDKHASLSHEPGWHEGVNTETYVEFTNGVRKLGSYICNLTVSLIADGGEPPLTNEEYRLVSQAMSA